MGVSYTIAGDVAEIKVIGRCTQGELFSGFEQMLAELSGNVHVLINVGESETLPPSEAIERIAFILGGAKGGFSGRIAVLVAHQVRYGLARQLSAYLDSFELVSEPFYAYEEAVAWLRGGKER